MTRARAHAPGVPPAAPRLSLTYFDRDVRVRDLDRVAVQHFVDWLTNRPGRDGRLCDRSIANAMTPLRLALAAAVAKGLLEANPADQVVLQRRRAGRPWSMRERRFLTRAELGQLLDEVPRKWRPLLELLAATGLRISEAIELRWSDLALDSSSSHLQVRRAVVRRVVVAPKSRHGARLIPLSGQVAATLRDIDRAAPHATPMCSPAAAARRPIRAACADACSHRRPSVPA